MRRGKRNHFSFISTSFNMQCNLIKFGTLIVNEYYHRCYLFNFCDSDICCQFVDSDIND